MNRTERIWRALAEVRDPEYPISVVDMGLIYAVRLAGSRVRVEMTFTATGCPCMGWIQADIQSRLLQEEGVAQVELTVVWDPPWSVDRLSPKAMEQLKHWGVSG